MAGLLRGVLANPGVLEAEDELIRVYRFANATGALTATRRGAIPALPFPEDVYRLLANLT
jgi:fructokinase